MKQLFITTLLFLLVSCDPNVVFRQPQPVGSKDLTRFPGSVRGTYLETSDDSTVYIITASYILQEYVEELELPLHELLEEEEVSISGDTLIIEGIDQIFPLTRRNDSIFGTVTIYDTIFDLSADYRLRKMQGNYFLNFPRDSLWMVLKLRFGKGKTAYLFDIEEGKEIETFEEHSRVEVIRNKKGKPSKYILDPDRKELKILLRMETFTDTTEFIRISD